MQSYEDWLEELENALWAHLDLATDDFEIDTKRLYDQGLTVDGALLEIYELYEGA